MKLDDGIWRSADGTLHVDPRWRWYPVIAGGGKLRNMRPVGSPTSQKLTNGVWRSGDGRIHVDPGWRWYPTREGGGKLKRIGRSQAPTSHARDAGHQAGGMGTS